MYKKKCYPFAIIFIFTGNHTYPYAFRKNRNGNSFLYKTYEWLTVHRIFNIRVYLYERAL